MILLINICGSDLTAFLGKSLELQSIHMLTLIVDRVQSRLAGWKGKVLNMAGRLTLVQSVCSTIPIYAIYANCLAPHFYLCCSLDKINRDFLWGDSVDQKEYSLGYIVGILSATRSFM